MNLFLHVRPRATHRPEGGARASSGFRVRPPQVWFPVHLTTLKVLEVARRRKLSSHLPDPAVRQNSSVGPALSEMAIQSPLHVRGVSPARPHQNPSELLPVQDSTGH